MDPQGLDALDRKLLLTIMEKFDGGPVGIESLSAAIGEERGTLEDVIEPFLIQQGFIARTARGRIATRLAWQHFGLKMPERAAANLPLFGEGDLSVFIWQARVYWEDTDAGGIVYYANYLRFLERARSEWLRARGVSQRALALDPGVVFSVVALEAQYRRPARLDDMLAISCEPMRDGGASLGVRAAHLARRPARRVAAAAASVRVACLDAAQPETPAPAGSHTAGARRLSRRRASNSRSN